MSEYNASICYSAQAGISIRAYQTLFERAQATTSRPIHNPPALGTMLDNTNLLITAWSCHQLIGLARGLSDFTCICYVNDILVDTRYHDQGIEDELLKRVKEAVSIHCHIMRHDPLWEDGTTTYSPPLSDLRHHIAS